MAFTYREHNVVTIFEQESEGFIRPTLDVQATEEAIEMLEPSKRGGFLLPSTVGAAILESAAYRLRVQLRQYLTRGTK